MRCIASIIYDAQQLVALLRVLNLARSAAVFTSLMRFGGFIPHRIGGFLFNVRSVIYSPTQHGAYHGTIRLRTLYLQYYIKVG